MSSFVEFRSVVSEDKSKNVSANQRSGGSSWFFFSIDPNNTNLVEDVETLLTGRPSCFFFPICPQNTNFLGNFEILLLVKFR